MRLESWYGVLTLECALSSFQYRAYKSYITKPQNICYHELCRDSEFFSERGTVEGRERMREENTGCMYRWSNIGTGVTKISQERGEVVSVFY